MMPAKQMGTDKELETGGHLEDFRSWAEQTNIRSEASLPLLYYLFYMIYLTVFIDFENELIHWLTLVFLPLSLLYGAQKRMLPDYSLRKTFSSIGLTQKNLKNGIPWALLAGLLFLPVQLIFSRQREKILELLSTGKFFWLFPLVFLLMVLTAGFTEEFFFRGVLQTRLALFFRSDLWAVLMTSLLFAMYHLPYAYFLEHWPSHGNLQSALMAVLIEAVPTGILLGILYARSKNLLTPILLHSTINAIAGVALIKFG